MKGLVFTASKEMKNIYLSSHDSFKTFIAFEKREELSSISMQNWLTFVVLQFFAI